MGVTMEPPPHYCDEPHLGVIDFTKDAWRDDLALSERA
jgi:hypothetical protein